MLPRPPRLDACWVALIALAVHLPCTTFGFVDLDDRDLIVEDQAFLARPASLLLVFGRSYLHGVDRGHAYYRPLVTASYALDAMWSGLRPIGYHITNVLLHVAASVLFLALLRRLSFGRAVACAAALVFAVHPAAVAVVAWIPGRNDSLLAIAVLGAWLLFLRECASPSWTWRLLHLACFWLALLTKETAIVIPLVCLAHLALRDAGLRTPSMRDRRGSVAVIVAGWASGIAARWALHPTPIAPPTRDVLRNWSLPLSSLGSLLAPINPSLLSVREDLSVWPGAVAALALLIAARIAPGMRGVRWRVIALGGATFLVLLGPVLLLPGTLVLESRLYAPACGAIIMVAEVVRAISRERAAFVAFSSVTLVALAAITMAYESTFRDARTFARGAVAAAPHSALAHFCLGQTYQTGGDEDRALVEYDLALSLGAVDVVHNNIAVIHMARGRWSDAEGELRAELAVDPGYGRAYRNLAIVLRHENRFDEARAADEQALRR